MPLKNFYNAGSFIRDYSKSIEEMSFFWLNVGVEQVTELLRITLCDLDHWTLCLHVILSSLHT